MLQSRFWGMILLASLLISGWGCEGEEGANEADTGADHAQSAEPNGAQVADNEPWQETLVFVAALGELMQGYTPPPAEIAGAPSLACVPQVVLRANRTLASESSQLERQRARAAREQAERREALLRTAGVYDPLWQIRTRSQASGGHCEWARNFSNNYMRDTLATTRAQCRTRVIQGVNRNRRWVPGPARTLYIHSGTTSPPTEAPALMSLAESASIQAPTTLHCRVGDVQRERRGGDVNIVCDIDPNVELQSLAINVGSGPIGWWTQGASVSVPLGGANSAYLAREPYTEGTWTIHADASQVTVSNAGGCPSPEDLLQDIRNSANNGD